MSHKPTFVDKTLQNIRINLTLMGGVTFVMNGDFRQILPVYHVGLGQTKFKSCVKASYLWKHLHKVHISTNMSIHLQEAQSAG